MIYRLPTIPLLIHILNDLIILCLFDSIAVRDDVMRCTILTELSDYN